MYMIMFVLNDQSYLDQILDSWSKLGVTGATIIESTGSHRRRLRRIPMRFTYSSEQYEDSGNITLFVIVDNEKLVHRCLKGIERIVGDLNDPHTGVYSAWPLIIIEGIQPRAKSEGLNNDLG